MKEPTIADALNEFARRSENLSKMLKPMLAIAEGRHRKSNFDPLGFRYPNNGFRYVNLGREALTEYNRPKPVLTAQFFKKHEGPLNNMQKSFIEGGKLENYEF